jgi:anaerobic magnesium-protoporphyrin IX monomethyl ester cyclase
MTQCDITLVNVSTAVSSREDGGREVYIPLGCLYLTSALERAGFSVDFRDYQLFAADSSYPLDTDLFQSFLAGSASTVGISCMVSMLPFVILGTKRFKQLNPKHRVILGGPGPSGAAREIVTAFPWIDAVCTGEGEITIVEALAAYKNAGDLASVPGLAFRDKSGIHHNKPRARIKEPDTIPPPAYDKVDHSAYTSVSIITGRGCPYRCMFCDVGPLWGNRTTYRSIENVIEELSLLKDRYGHGMVNLADDTFDLRKDRAEALCGEISKLHMTWTCLARIDLLDERLIETMAHSGCKSIFLGIESGSDSVLQKIGKKFTIKEATIKTELCTRYMDKVVTSYIWGFPFETLDDFKQTILSVVSMWELGAMAGLKLLSPMPLSPLGIQYRDRLEFSDDFCSVFASLGNVVPGEMSKRAGLPDELKKIIKNHPEIFSGFYYIKSDSIHEKAAFLEKFSKKMGIPV